MFLVWGSLTGVDLVSWQLIAETGTTSGKHVLSLPHNHLLHMLQHESVAAEIMHKSFGIAWGQKTYDHRGLHSTSMCGSVTMCLHQQWCIRQGPLAIMSHSILQNTRYTGYELPQQLEFCAYSHTSKVCSNCWSTIPNISDDRVQSYPGSQQGRAHRSPNLTCCIINFLSKHKGFLMHLTGAEWRGEQLKCELEEIILNWLVCAEWGAWNQLG